MPSLEARPFFVPMPDITPLPSLPPLRRALARLALRLAAVQVRVSDDAKGWTSLLGRPNDRPWAQSAELYRNALEATRKNPLAKAIVDITTDFVIGDGILLSSPHARLQRFLEQFWHHPLNLLDQRLQGISDELARAGDLFVLLFRNVEDGMSYVRFVTKEQIVGIETAPNDWETEIAYQQATADPTQPAVWLSPRHPEAAAAEAVMLHYAVNRPIGASFGEGDLDTIIPWLLRYSRMLEDRVRLHWALRTFLWFVTVPTGRVQAKRGEYATPPEAGSIIVKDDAEEWEVKAPTLHAADARHDLEAVRHMIDAAGFPPHWRGEGGDANLATAQAMQLRPERHLRRRQNYLVHVLQDMVYVAFQRAAEIGLTGGAAPPANYGRLFTVGLSDISRQDNAVLAQAARDLTAAFDQLFNQLGPQASPTLTRLALKLILKFAGEPQEEALLAQMMAEIGRSKRDA
ncbi:MAG: hypothetical protein ACRDHL_13755 [Candidatus Promineifilaceae bacterium]